MVIFIEGLTKPLVVLIFLLLDTCTVQSDTKFPEEALMKSWSFRLQRCLEELMLKNSSGWEIPEMVFSSSSLKPVDLTDVLRETSDKMKHVFQEGIEALKVSISGASSQKIVEASVGPTWLLIRCHEKALQE
ncbi:unnamed protein product [Cyprideis torosa]|uniref:Uncharacterized protein n=1 Tax=Cyprideis torosa TaxID=163714 RepID=A0A7R8ZS20_9CRUS|nr:unnamed protein product [Cyprideis torosa]CAG0900504.1 unnamed protein product [Cyprideis torosa]